MLKLMEAILKFVLKCFSKSGKRLDWMTVNVGTVI